VYRKIRPLVTSNCLTAEGLLSPRATLTTRFIIINHPCVSHDSRMSLCDRHPTKLSASITTLNYFIEQPPSMTSRTHKGVYNH
jgi:hypothetical protein